MHSPFQIVENQPIFKRTTLHMGKGIKAVIIDDESNCREALAKQLKWVCPEIQVVATAANAAQGIDAIKTHRPDLIFLDIDMPDKSGFDLLKDLDAIDFEIIFTTAYDQYALEAFKVKALDYLLKPIDEDALIDAVDRVSLHLGRKSPLRQLEDFLSQTQPSTSDQRLSIPTAEGVHFIMRSTIVRCEAEGAYCRIFYDQNKQLLVSKTLRQMELIINSNSFLRVHQSHLINTNFIDKYLKAQGGEIILKDGSSIPISRSKREFWNEWIKG